MFMFALLRKLFNCALTGSGDKARRTSGGQDQKGRGGCGTPLLAIIAAIVAVLI